MVRNMTNQLVPIGSNLPEWIQVETAAMSEFDYEQIKLEFSSHHARSKRHWLLLTEMLKATGLRLAEVMRLTPDHIKIEGPYVHILVKRGKRQDKEKSDIHTNLPLNPIAASNLLAYIKAENVRPGQKIWPQTARAYQLAFKKASLAALGVDRHPHELRALYTMDLANNQNLPIEKVGYMVGHSSLETTRKHYYKLTPQEMYEINARVRV